MSNERLKYLQSYFNNQKVKVEVPVVEYMTSKGKVVHYFNGKRNGYYFKQGVAMIDRKNVHLFENQHYIIHEDTTKGEN